MCNYIDSNALLTHNIDLNRKVRFKNIKEGLKKKRIYDRPIFSGHSYAGFKRLGIINAEHKAPKNCDISQNIQDWMPIIAGSSMRSMPQC